jgi:hypothetical protein
VYSRWSSPGSSPRVATTEALCPVVLLYPLASSDGRSEG